MKSRFLTYTFAISVALNVAFLTTFFSKRPRQPRTITAIKTTVGSLAQMLDSHIDLARKELYSLLNDTMPVEEGYAICDIALSCLVSKHKFDIERALGMRPSQQRRIALVRGGDEIQLTLFPGLSEHDRLEIAHFAKTEVWPLTAEGLFNEWKKGELDPALQEALAMTAEYRHAQAVLAAKGIFLAREDLLSFLKELARPIEIRYLEISEEGARAMLLSALKEGISMAASLSIEHDKEFVIKCYSDEELFLLLDLGIQHPTMELVAKNLLCSIRSDSVRQAAAEVLYTIRDEPIPDPFDHQEALKTFLPTFFKPQSIATKVHIVADGDTLWDIARKYHLTVNELLSKNNLTKESLLRPGMKLELSED